MLSWKGGAWYRALTYVAMKRGVDLTDTEKLKELVRELGLEVFLGEDGKTHFSINGQDVTRDLYDSALGPNIPIVAAQLPVRELMEPLIVNAVRSQESVVVVGRHMKKALPEAAVMRLVIDETEADRRHGERSGDATQSVADRNKRDKAIAAMLGVTNDGVTELDVTRMDKVEQAEALRRFIGQSFPDTSR